MAKMLLDCMDDFWQEVAKFVFNVSILLFSQVPTLHCKQTQASLKNYNSGLGFLIASTQPVF